MNAKTGETQPLNEEEQRAFRKRFACEEVWPALKGLVESDLQNWEGLLSAGATMVPERRQEWQALVGEAKEKLFPQDLGAPGGLVAEVQFHRLIKLLNERWFVPRQILLATGPDNRPRRDQSTLRLWDHVRVGVHTLERTNVCRFHDGEVHQHYVRTIHPTSRQEFTRLVVSYAVEGYVVVNVGVLENDISNTCALHQSLTTPNPDLDRHLLGEGTTEAKLAAWKEHARFLIPEYPSPQAVLDAVVARAIPEELRHAINAKRVAALTGLQAGEEGYRLRFGESVLAPQGQLRFVWCCLASDRQRAGMAVILDELAAQITACALGRNPRLVLAEWRRNMQERAHPKFDPDLETSVQHGYAAALGLLLLAQELRIVPRITVEYSGFWAPPLPQSRSRRR